MDYNTRLTVVMPNQDNNQLPLQLLVFGGAKKDVLKVMGSTFGDTIAVGDMLSASQFQVDGVNCLAALAGGGNDTVSNTTAAVPSVIDLDAGDDIAVGGGATDVVYGGPGREIDIDTNDGRDFVFPDHDPMGNAFPVGGEGDPLEINGGAPVGGAVGDVGVFLTNSAALDRVTGFEELVGVGALINDVIFWLTGRPRPVGDIGPLLALGVANKCANWTSPYVGNDLGVLGSASLPDLNAATGDLWYEFEAAQDGTLSFEALFAVGATEIKLYNHDFVELASNLDSHGNAFLTHQVNVGAEYYVRVRGSASDVDVTLNVGGPDTIAPTVIAASVGVQGGSISTALPSALAQLPWSIDQVSLQFSEAVTVGPSDLAVTGISGTQYTISTSPSAFNYDAATRTATWTLATPVVADQITLSLATAIADRSGNVLDGETIVSAAGGAAPTTQALPSGNSAPGGEFQLQFSVLTGDYTQDGVVNFVDVVAVRNLIGTASALADLDRDGIVGQNDMVRTMLAALMTPQLPSFSTPPSPSPAAPAPSVDAAVVSIAREEARTNSGLTLRSVSRRREAPPASATDEAIGEISREATRRRIRRR
jgi:hypothetical protein